MEDHLAWHFNPRGIFSVKSAYKVAVMVRDRLSGREAAHSGSSATSGPSFDWNHIWKLNVSGKIKMFIWCLAHNSLANRMKIHKLGIDLDTKYPVCNRLNEDGGHAFLKCKKELWNCDEATQVRSVTLMWEWWNQRNKANTDKDSPDPNVVCSHVERLLIDFMSLWKLEKPAKPPNTHKWSKPPNDYVKINFDSSFNVVFVDGGWGFVIRDQEGFFVAAGVGKSKNPGSALQSEVVACLAAINGACRVGASQVSSNLMPQIWSRV
ncbi:uncharacterized protein [Lolium perenne]|uniref:uncharacterized protein n=1 Tax=Lolium perenne TaxID=4522 RepID=UPI003A9A2996